MQTDEKRKEWKKGGRKITLKYDAECKDCGAVLPAGTSARWYGRGRIYGNDCHENQHTPGNPSGASISSPPAPAPAPRPPADLSEKFRNMGDNLTRDIEDCFRDRTQNTPKQQQQAGYARLNGMHSKRTQEALYALADLHEAGQVPDTLKGFRHLKTIHEATRSEMDHATTYYGVGVDLGKPLHTTPEALALWGLIQGQTEEEKKAEELTRKVNGLKFSNIPGYFPTPQPVIDLMIEHADIYSSHTILEPSAGSGALMDAVKPFCHSVQGVEINHTLSQISTSKGHAVHFGDFLNWFPLTSRYDRVLMNPPFEKGQDIDHIKHAFEMLEDGGRLVSVISPGPFFHSTKKAEAFRQWLNELGAEVIDLPEGSFKESGTGVASKLVVIDK